MELSSIVAVLAVAAVARHLVARVVVSRAWPALQEQTRAKKRFEARVEELGLDDSIAHSEERARIMEEEGCSARPLLTLLATTITISLVWLVAVWWGILEVGGPLAENYWWLGLGWIVVTVATTLMQERRGVALIGALFGVTVIAFPFGVVYTLAPCGVVGFLVLASLVGKIGWRLFPGHRSDMPNVAMLFL